MVSRKTTSKENSGTMCNLNQVQLQRLADLNSEFLRCNIRLNRALMDHYQKYNIPIPDEPKIDYLVGQILCLIDEINGTNTNNRYLTRRKPTDDLPEPCSRFCKLDSTSVEFFIAVNCRLIIYPLSQILP